VTAGRPAVVDARLERADPLLLHLLALDLGLVDLLLGSPQELGLRSSVI